MMRTCEGCGQALHCYEEELFCLDCDFFTAITVPAPASGGEEPDQAELAGGESGDA